MLTLKTKINVFQQYVLLYFQTFCQVDKNEIFICLKNVLFEFLMISSNTKDTGHMSSNDFGATDVGVSIISTGRF